jgi:hypothetical protein
MRPLYNTHSTSATLQHSLLFITSALLFRCNAFQVKLSSISKFRRTNNVADVRLHRHDVNIMLNGRPSQSDAEPNDQQLVSTNCTYPVRPACISGRIIYTLCWFVDDFIDSYLTIPLSSRCASPITDINGIATVLTKVFHPNMQHNSSSFYFQRNCDT